MPCDNKNTVGNTVENIVNGGQVVVQGDWVYYFDSGEYATEKDGYASNFVSKKGLYAIRKDGTNRREILDGYVEYINVIDKQIYCCNDGLISVKTDGTDKCLLYTSKYTSDINVVDDKIYFRDFNTLYSMNKDGSNLQCIFTINNNKYLYKLKNVFVLGEKIYFIIEGHHDNLYRMNTDGSDIQKLSSNTTYAIAKDNKIYYQYKMSGTIYTFICSMNLDGTEKQRIFYEHMSLKTFNVTNDKIYYSRRYIRKRPHNDNNLGLYSINLDCSEKKKIFEDKLMFDTGIYIVDDSFYYLKNGMRIRKPDGSDNLIAPHVEMKVQYEFGHRAHIHDIWI